MFVLPGQRLQVTSALVTNFDLPRSTPLTLTCVFAGRDPVLRAHREAMEQRHRLYRSDAMLIV